MEAPLTDEQNSDSMNHSQARVHHPSPARSHPASANNTAATQPLLALSGLGLAYGSLKSALRRIKRSASISPFKLPKYVRRLPKYMKSNYVKYPVLFLVFMAAAKRVRTAINH